LSAIGALGSASETEYHFLLARGLGFLSANDYAVLSAQVVELKRMLTSLHQNIQRQAANNNQMRSK
jgi:four helix bundle protein